MDENLLGYLFKTLDPDAQQRVEDHVRQHAEAQARLATLERALQPLAADAEPPAPPPGLVVATLARVAEHKCHSLPPAPLPSRHQVGAPGRRWPRRADLLVAACLLVLVGGLGGPLLLNQWRASQRRACADNLRRFWVSLEAYSHNTEGDFPRVEAEGPHSVAGIFVPVLNDAGLLREVSVTCPSQETRLPTPPAVRDLEELYRKSPASFRGVIRDLPGGYAYTLGYREGTTHCCLRRDSGDNLPIMADRPPPLARGNSPNHGGAGQNVLFIGGTVRWFDHPHAGINGDDIYLNQEDEIGAGLNRGDTVLGHGDATPYKWRD